MLVLTETRKFYLLLSQIGTDFSLMCRLFPDRSRTDIKVSLFTIQNRIQLSSFGITVFCSFNAFVYFCASFLSWTKTSVGFAAGFWDQQPSAVLRPSFIHVSLTNICKICFVCRKNSSERKKFIMS